MTGGIELMFWKNHQSQQADGLIHGDSLPISIHTTEFTLYHCANPSMVLVVWRVIKQLRSKLSISS
jgi:hypothetical protein